MGQALTHWVAMATLVSALAGCGGGEDDRGPDCSHDPCDLQATPGPGPGQVTLNWRPLEDADTTWVATSYNVYLASSSGVSQRTYSTLPDGRGIGRVTDPHVVSCLEPGKTYYFVVTANVTNKGELPLYTAQSNPSNEVAATVAVTPVASPEAPAGLRAAAGVTSVDVEWDAPTPEQGVLSYVVYMAKEPWTVWSEGLFGARKASALGARTTSVWFSGLEPGTRYWFAVSAVCREEGAQSAQIAVETRVQ